MNNKNYSQRFIIKLYASLYRIRRVEEEIIRIYPTDKIKSPVHLSIGQESVSVGICEALQPGDVVFGTYRSHALYLARGGDLKRMIAELYGKETGCAKGKGGSMHLIDINAGVMGTSAIVGTTIPLAVGYAYSLKFNRSNKIAVSFFGDGAVDEGVFHESMNFAALKNLPVLFICENNQYAIHSHHLSRHKSDNIVERAGSYGMRTEKISTNDVCEIFDRAKEHIKNIREGEGPAFLEIETSRWKEHVGPNDDFDLGYRTEAEVSSWKKRDFLVKLKERIDRASLKKINDEIDEEVRDAVKFAEESVFPPKENLFADICKE